jgi:hypothetical protein
MSESGVVARWVPGRILYSLIGWISCHVPIRQCGAWSKDWPIGCVKSVIWG